MPLSTLVRAALIATLATGFAGPALAQAKKPTPAPSAATRPVEVVEESDRLKINWTTGQLTISGIGVPGDRGPMSYKRSLSSRAAMADAYRRLAAGLETMRVDTNSRVKDLAVADDKLRTSLNEFVKAAEVLETNYWPDGSTEIVLGVKLKGESSLAALIANPMAAASPAPSASPSAAPEDSEEPTMRGYSSLIVDARGLGAQPALLPNLRDADGKVVELDVAGVKYLRDGADLDTSTGIAPLRLKARGTQGALKADVVLTPEATQALKKALTDKRVAPDATLIVLI